MEPDMTLTLSRMMRFCAVPLAIICLSAAFAGTASAAGGSAFDISASFTSGGVTTGIAPVNRVADGGARNYGKGSDFGPYNRTLVIAAGKQPLLTLTINATALKAYVKGAFGIDRNSAVSAAAVDGLELKLAPYTPPNSNVVPQPFIHIKAGKLYETGSWYYFPRNMTSVSSSSAIAGLSVTGSLVGSNALTFSGQPVADKLLFQSPTVTITLNHRLQGGLISCTPKCLYSPAFIDTSALEITLNNADLNGRKVSGQIDIGVGKAGSEMPL